MIYYQHFLYYLQHILFLFIFHSPAVIHNAFVIQTGLPVPGRVMREFRADVYDLIRLITGFHVVSG